MSKQENQQSPLKQLTNRPISSIRPPKRVELFSDAFRDLQCQRKAIGGAWTTTCTAASCANSIMALARQGCSHLLIMAHVPVPHFICFKQQPQPLQCTAGARINTFLQFHRKFTVIFLEHHKKNNTSPATSALTKPHSQVSHPNPFQGLQRPFKKPDVDVPGYPSWMAQSKCSTPWNGFLTSHAPLTPDASAVPWFGMRYGVTLWLYEPKYYIHVTYSYSYCMATHIQKQTCLVVQFPDPAHRANHKSASSRRSSEAWQLGEVGRSPSASLHTAGAWSVNFCIPFSVFISLEV